MTLKTKITCILISFLSFVRFNNSFSQSTTVNFNFTGSSQSWTVPPCVTSVAVSVSGASGGGTASGLGATITGNITVTPGDVITIQVGGTGTGTNATYGGGGSGQISGIGFPSFAGGGASSISLNGTVIIVAGGGGGTGGGDTFSSGGNGGCPDGTIGQTNYGGGGGPGTLTSGGIGGILWDSGGTPSGQNGSLGQGGNGGVDLQFENGPGGGGGGGYYGGGGGGSDNISIVSFMGGGGGGGGSSLIPSGSNCIEGNNSGNGIISFTFIQSQIVIPTFNAIPELCQFDTNPSLPLTSTNNPSVSGTWSPPIASTLTAGTYTHTFTPNSGQCAQTVSIVITVLPEATPTFNQIPQLCQNDPNPILPATSTNNPSISGTWNPPTIDTSIPGVFTHTFSPTGIQCPVDVDMTISIVPSAPPSFIADNLSGCNPLPVNFSTVNPIPGANYTWYWNNNEIGTGSSLSYILDASGYHDITLEYELSSCSETTTYDDYIFIENDPIASFTSSPGVISSEIESISFLNSTIGATTYLWEFGDNTTSTNQNPTHTYIGASDNILVSLTASSPLGCSDIYELTLVVLSEAIFYIPNTFTPDEDEHNQLWRPIFTSGFDIYSFQLEIYNRWGEIIWETNNASAGWDGTYGINGLKVPSGIYNWTIRYGSKINDDTNEVSGHVNVLY